MYLGSDMVSQVSDVAYRSFSSIHLNQLKMLLIITWVFYISKKSVKVSSVGRFSSEMHEYSV